MTDHNDHADHVRTPDAAADATMAGFGSAKHPGRPCAHPRPRGLDDARTRALGRLSEALEVVEQARGHLYAFHRLSGTADRTLQDAVAQLADAGESDVAAEIDDVLVGRDVLPGLWTFQVVEAYDDGYWQVFREVERATRARLGGADRHVAEAEMKVVEQGGSLDVT